MYEDCKVYGPYKSKEDNRLRVIIIDNEKKHHTVSYPKYLVECDINRYLTENETIDHIDGNFLNNERSNLQIIERKEHCSLDISRNKDVTVTCVYCGKNFIIKGSTLHQRNRKQSGYFCSRYCSGKYGKEIQLKITIPTIKEKEQIVKYKIKHTK